MPSDRSETEILESIAANVVRLRRARRLTQEGLAEAAGLDLRAVQRIERATINFGVVGLIRLAAALGTQVGVLARRAKFKPAKRGRPSAP